MKNSLIALAVLAALASTGCASIENAGYREVKVTHTADGKGCDLATKDGKEEKSFSEKFDGKNCTYETKAEDVKAFRGQGIAAKALTILPVNDLVELAK